MLLLAGTSDLVRVVTDATADIEVHASWVENAAGTITPGRTNTASITTATTTTVVGSPASSVQRNVKHLSIRNNHASTTCNVTVDHTDGTNAEELITVALLAGELLALDELGNWTHYDTNGGEYPVTGIAVASQGEMESASSVIVAVTPGRQHFHPGHPKCFCKCGITGNDLGSYNITSITDTGAGIATVNVATDFSGSNWTCVATAERTSTALTVGSLKFINIRFSTQTAGVVGLEIYDGTATTAVQEDPTAYHMVGLGDI
jgi:hypothetical protein